MRSPLKTILRLFVIAGAALLATPGCSNQGAETVSLGAADASQVGTTATATAAATGIQVDPVIHTTTEGCTLSSSVSLAFKTYTGDCSSGNGQHDVTQNLPVTMVSATAGYVDNEQNWQFCDSHFHKVVFRDFYLFDVNGPPQPDGTCASLPTSQTVLENDNGCLAGNTLISLADGSAKEARDLAVGDLVRGTGAEPLRIAKVFAASASGEPLVQLDVRGGTLTLTGNHPVETPSGLVPAATIKVGDRLVGAQGRQVIVTGRSLRVAQNESVYNFRFAGAASPERGHLFFAGGIAVGDVALENQLAAREYGDASSFPSFLDELKDLSRRLLAHL